jgi:hypothetical protein
MHLSACVGSSETAADHAVALPAAYGRQHESMIVLHTCTTLQARFKFLLHLEGFTASSRMGQVGRGPAICLQRVSVPVGCLPAYRL